MTNTKTQLTIPVLCLTLRRAAWVSVWLLLYYMCAWPVHSRSMVCRHEGQALALAYVWLDPISVRECVLCGVQETWSFSLVFKVSMVKLWLVWNTQSQLVLFNPLTSDGLKQCSHNSLLATISNFHFLIVNMILRYYIRYLIFNISNKHKYLVNNAQ